MSRHRRHKRQFVFEHRDCPILPRSRFYLRLAWTALIAASIVFASLGVGIVGFHYIESLDWVDSLLNASMLLSGMGPLHNPTCVPGKLFASFYALFSGLVFLTVAAVLFAPVFHRLIHKFHLHLEEDPPEPK